MRGQAVAPTTTSTQTPAARPPAGDLEPGARAVQHLEALLTRTERAGGDREAGTDGERAAAGYAATVLRDAGLRVSEQTVRFPHFDERSPARVTVGGRAVGTRREVRTIGGSPSGDVRGRLRVVAPDRADSGCRAADLEAVRPGEIVLAGRGVCPFAVKARLALRAGAAAIVVADREAGAAPRATLGDPAPDGIPSVAVGRTAGRRLRAAAGRTVRVVTDTVAGRRRSPNVLAATPGARVMVGAHLDSVPGAPGANDNASGLAVTLAAAEVLAREGVAVRVGLWGAEEVGLVGSRRFVRALSRAERRRLRAYVNLDMVASPNAVVSVYGHARVRAALRGALGGAAGTDLGGASDHAPFARAGIPAGGLFTGASARKTAREAARHGGRAGRPLDPCYHRPCDDAGNVDRRALRRSARAATVALRSLAAP